MCDTDRARLPCTPASAAREQPGDLGGSEGAAVTHSAGILFRAAHPGPTLAVGVLAGVLCLPAGLTPGRALLVVAAVLTGQLSIGWSNDLLDRARDHAVGRADKPLAAGQVPLRRVRAACVLALAATIVLSLALGPAPGLLHLLVVASGWAYNLGLKATLGSAVPYAVAFGALPLAVWGAGDLGWPPVWVPVAGALLGVGAHLLNAVPDLADDAATGVQGLPHRLGAQGSRVLAAGLLAAASLLLTLGNDALPALVRGGSLTLALALAGVAVLARGRGAFRAAVGIALVDVVVLAAAR